MVHFTAHVATAIGTDGLPIIACYDTDNGIFEVAHCASRSYLP
ncbi:MAG: hypothetical protein OEM62_09760 [Acidobacteriota bacterium]|nr:hypothetical protein [Acidobacteriota bacterium]